MDLVPIEEACHRPSVEYGRYTTSGVKVRTDHQDRWTFTCLTALRDAHLAAIPEQPT